MRSVLDDFFYDRTNRRFDERWFEFFSILTALLMEYALFLSDRFAKLLGANPLVIEYVVPVEHRLLSVDRPMGQWRC